MGDIFGKVALSVLKDKATISDLLLSIRVNGARQCVVSFLDDDGYDAAYTTLKPIFEAASIPWSMALVTGYNGQITDVHMAEAYAMGCDFASHTVNHSHLPTLTEAQIDADFKNSKKHIEGKGYPCEYIVYPFGEHDATVRKVAKNYFKFGIQTGGAVNEHPIKTYAISRIAVGSNYDGVSDNTLEYYKAAFDEAYNNKTWVIFMLHGSAVAFDATQQGYLADLITYVQAAGTPILTVSEAYKLMGNAFSNGDGLTENFVISNTGDVFEANALYSSAISVQAPAFLTGTGTSQTSPVNFTDECPIDVKITADDTIASPKVISVGKNIWGGLKAAKDIITAVNNATYAYYAVVDGKRCIALKGNSALLVSLFTGAFIPSTRYVLSGSWRRADDATMTGGSVRFQYTDDSYSASVHPANTTWTDFGFGSAADKSVKNVSGNYGNNNQTIYIDLDTLQVTIGTSTPTSISAYKESRLEITATLAVSDVVTFENGKCWQNATKVAYVSNLKAFKDGTIYVLPTTNPTVSIIYPLNPAAKEELNNRQMVSAATV